MSVIMEHFEDVLVEYGDRWLFIQVKTRNANQGPWRLSNAMSGLKSLHRAYQQAKHLESEYSLHLEGSIAAQDLLEELVPEKPSTLSDDLRRRLANGLSITEAECDAFLEATTVRDDRPPRDHIVNKNLEAFSRYAPGMSWPELEAVHRTMADEVLAAMARDRLGPLIPRYVEDPNALEEDARSQVRAKRLTRESLMQIMEPVVSGGYLLRQQVATNTELTKLEQKLVVGGANPSLIEDAKMLRSNASEREYECLSAELYDNAQMEDVQNRLRVLANAVVAKHREGASPATQAWGEVLSELQRQAADLDRHRIYLRDPYLLLGAICSLTDECRVDWGVPVA